MGMLFLTSAGEGMDGGMLLCRLGLCMWPSQLS